jgi:hypothetical protein
MLALLLASSGARAQEVSSYICVTDMATGFRFDQGSKTWQQARFNASSKYIVSRPKERSMFSWELREVGSQDTRGFCKNDFNEVGNLFCDTMGGQFKFSKGTLRFIHTYAMGYWHDQNPLVENKYRSKEGADTPFIEIGKCSPL